MTTDGSDAVEYRTEENPFTADDPQQQHLKRAMEIIEHEMNTTESHGPSHREVYDAMAHLRMATVLGIMGDDDE